MSHLKVSCYKGNKTKPHNLMQTLEGIKENLKILM